MNLILTRIYRSGQNSDGIEYRTGVVFFTNMCLGNDRRYCCNIWYGKTRMLGLLGGEKKFENIFTCFDIIHEHDGQTDGHRKECVGRAMRSVARQSQ